MRDITIPDIEAFVDVLNQISDEATVGGMSVERAAALLQALQSVKKPLADATSFLETAALTALEGTPRLIGNKVYSQTPNRKKRPNHPSIQAGVHRYARWDENYEPYETEVAVDRAIAAMQALFVAPATPPKTEGLKLLKITNDDAFEWVTISNDLKITDVGTSE